MTPSTRFRPWKESITAFFFFVLTLAIIGLRLACGGLPPLPSPSSPADPDQARLEAHVRALSPLPRPIGTTAHQRARDYILQELHETGVEVATQNAFSVRSFLPGVYSAGRVENIIARVRGRPGRRAVLLVCHYDSVEAGPGAADDGSAVAGMLEAMRLTAASPPPYHDLIFLFSDGEEEGLLGAEAFARDSPLARTVQAVFNFDARGTRGPARLFETGPGSGALVRRLAAGAPWVNGTSLANAVYSLLPNNTDFSIFKDQNRPGLNFAFIGDVPAYHTRLDTAARLDPRTLRHQAINILSCARIFGNDPRLGESREEAVFFPLIGPVMIVYPALLAPILTVLTVLILAGVLAAGVRRRRLALGKSLLAGAGLFGFVVAAGGLTWLVQRLVILIAPDTGLAAEPYGAPYLRIAFAILPLLPLVAARLLIRRRLSLSEILSGACLLLAPPALLSAFLLPGANFLYQWPLLFGALYLGFHLFLGRPGRLVWIRRIVMVGLSVPTLFLAADTFATMFEGLTISAAWAVSAQLVPFIAVLWPIFEEIFPPGKKLMPTVGLTLLAGCLVAGPLASRFSAAQPRPENLAYGLDADTGRAVWFRCGGPAETWSGRFFQNHATIGPLPQFFPMVDGCLFQGKGFQSTAAAPLERPAPLLDVLSDRRLPDGFRERDFELRSRRGARRLALFIQRTAGLGSVFLEGRRLEENAGDSLRPVYKLMQDQIDYRHWIVILYVGLPDVSLHLRVTGSGNEPLVVRVLDETIGLSDLGPLGLPPRPPASMPGLNPLVPNGIIVAREYRFP